ncbi:hypothetical protein OROHE_017309 [Orobanche hederae]
MSATSILMIAAMLAAAATAQSPSPAPGMALPPAAPGPFYNGGAPAPSLDCFTYLLNLSDCLTFVEGGSNLTKPDPGCCPELSNLVDTQPICLCQLLGDPSQVGISVDVNRALRLPSLCSVSTPPVSLCADQLVFHYQLSHQVTPLHLHLAVMKRLRHHLPVVIVEAQAT